MSDIDARVSQVEQQIAGLASTVENLVESVSQSNRQITRLADDTRTTLERRTQTQWSPLIGAAGLIIAILGSLFSVVAFNQDKRIDDLIGVVESLEKSFHIHDKSYGHLAIRERVQTNSNDLLALDTKLQKEMELTNDKSSKSLLDLEKRLQEEMIGMKENNQLRSQGLDGIQQQQIEELQRVIFSDEEEWDRVIRAIKEIK